MSFPDDFREFHAWRNGFEASPERWVEYKKMEAVYDDHQENLLKYEIGLDLVELIHTLLNQGAEDSDIGDAVRRSYGWDTLYSVDDEPE